MVKSGQTWTGIFVTEDSTGALSTPSVGPAGVLYVAGTANGATVTVSGSNPYKWSVTLPTLTAGQTVSMYITATISGIATAQVVAEEIGDTKLVSDLNDLGGTAQTGDSYARIGAAGAGLTALGDTRLANLDATVSSRSTITAAQVNTEADTALADAGVTTTVTGRIDAAISSRLASAGYSAPPSAATVADAVWDEALSGHATAGSAGAALSAAGAASDPLLNTVPGSYASGTAGHALGRIGSGQIQTTSTVAQNGDMEEVFGGATYDADDGYSFDWTDSSASWPVLTGATVRWCAVAPNGQTSNLDMTVVTATGASKKVRLELTAVQSAALEAAYAGGWSFVVWATLTSGSIIPLLTGTVPVRAEPGPA